MRRFRTDPFMDAGEAVSAPFRKEGIEFSGIRFALQHGFPFQTQILRRELYFPDTDGPEDVARHCIGGTLQEYPGSLEWDGDRQIWAFPLTEEMTRSWNMQKIRAQVGVKVDGDDFHYSPTFDIAVGSSIIRISSHMVILRNNFIRHSPFLS